MPEQITPLSVLYLLLHGAGIAVGTMLSLYLLLCRGKAIAPDIDLTTPNMIYGLVLAVLVIIYMVVAVRQYGRWLHDNYADLDARSDARNPGIYFSFK